MALLALSIGIEMETLSLRESGKNRSPRSSNRWKIAFLVATLLSALEGGVVAFTSDKRAEAWQGLVVFAFLLPYAVMLWGLRRHALGRSVLWLAKGVGLVQLVMAVYLALIFNAGDVGVMMVRGIALVLLGIAPGFLILSASKLSAWADGKREGSTVRWVAALAGVGYLGVSYFARPLPQPPVWTRQAMAVSSLYTINKAASAYYSSYRNGFPASLTVLGAPTSGAATPSCHSSSAVDALLAEGRKNGYLFRYTPGPSVDIPAQDCPPGVKSYPVTARPLQYGKTGRANYFTDETGVIRTTHDDRLATAQDPALE